ncbi:MAG: glycosyltransferase family 4 protein, partial [Thermoanaerobaculia bacterium]
MKLLLVSQYFWPESFRVNDLIRAWGEQGHEVTVLTGLPNYPAGHLFDGYSWRGPYRERFAGAPVQRVPMLTRGARRGIRLALNYFSFVLAGSLLGPLLLRRRFDLVFVYAPSPITCCIPALWLKRLRGTPVALWVQDLWPDSLAATGVVRSPAVLRLVAALTSWIYRRCDLLLVQSPAFVAGVRRVWPQARDVRVLPNWAEALYRPLAIEPEAPERREIPPGFTVVFAGNLGSAQALDAALAAAELARGDGIQWVFIGDGNQREWLERESRSRGLADVVKLLGWRPPERMPRYLALADVLLVSLRKDPSLASTVPTKLQSALAAGRPVLAALEGEG